MPDYLTPVGPGWKYQRAVPKRLQAIIGKQIWSIYLGQVSKPEAQVKVHTWAVVHDAQIAAIKKLTPDELAEVTAAGGVNGIAQEAETARVSATFQSAP